MAIPTARKGLLTLNCRRFNYVGAAYVNAALTILKLYGFQRAINLLEAAKIPDTVMTRVLQSDGLVRKHQSVILPVDQPTR
jgi:hypothetical protein